MGEGVPGNIWPLPIQKKIEAPKTVEETNEQRIEREQAYINEFRDKLKVITEGEVYTDPYGFSKAPLEGFDADTWQTLKVLLHSVMGPVLKDTVEDTFDEQGRVIKGVRKEYRAKVNALGQEKKDFYDANKLEAGNIGGTLAFAEMLESEIAQYNKKYSEEIKNEHARLTSEFSGPDNPHGPYDPAGYAKLKNADKYEFEKKYTELLERILCEVFGKEFKG